MSRLVFALSLLICVSNLFGQNNPDNKELLLFAKALEKGEKYVGRFVHPFTGDTMERKIEGIIKDRCIYIEQMPNGGKMICHYKVKDLKRLAKYYRQFVLADSVSVSAHVEFGTDSLGNPSSSTTIDNNVNEVEQENPMQECLSNGDCTIEGYGNMEASITIYPSVFGGSMGTNQLTVSVISKADKVYTIKVEAADNSCIPMIYKNPSKEIFKCNEAEYQIGLDLKSSTDMQAAVNIIRLK